MVPISSDTSAQLMLKRLIGGSLSLVTVAVLSACGGGSGGAPATNNAPLELGAALPDSGDFIAIEQEFSALAEAERSGTVTVVRRGQTSGDVSVGYRFLSGTASEDDFHGVDGTLSWSAGDNSNRSIRFLVASDIEAEAVEQFTIELFDIKGQESLGINDRASISIADSACSGSVPATIGSNTQLSQPCYRLQGTATVGGAAQLDIHAGTTIIADPGSAIRFTASSSISAQGTQYFPVTLKGVTNEPGLWNGVALHSSSALHRISHTTIANATDAVALSQGELALFDNNHLANNAAAGLVLPMRSAENLATNNEFSETPRGIELLPSTIEENQTVRLPAQSTHYVLSDGLVNKGTWVLEAGTDLRMAADVPVLVLSSGAINAVGTADKPIRISGLEARPGYWNGIQYVSSTSALNRFEYATIAHGGGDPARAGNIIVAGLDTQITFIQCAITHSAGFGIEYDSGAFQIDLQEVRFEQNQLGEHSL